MSRVLPILFNTEMVRAILDGRKTVTRRVINQEKYLGVLQSPSRRCNPEIPDEYYIKRLVDPPYEEGDTLYVRESWAFPKCIVCKQIDCHKMPITRCEDDVSVEGCYIYRADHPHPKWITWKPSIHMPKAAARIWLRVTDIKIQRLQDMTLDDFLREGVVMLPEAFNDPENVYQQARTDFIDIWDSTIPKGQQALYGWNANSWIWAIEFERCEKPEPCILKGIAPAEDKRPCIGYQKSKEDDEPCEMCKGCRACSGEETESEE